MSISPFFVTNGERTVGPVSTGGLIRGIATGLVGEGCMLWQHPWQDWREMETVREVRAFLVAQGRRPAGWVPSKGWAPPPSPRLFRALSDIGTAADEAEAVALTLQAACSELRADAGVVHRPTSALGEFRIRTTVGDGMSDQLGAPTDPMDPAMKLARFGATVLAKPWSRAAGIASMERLRGSASELSGIALAPIFLGGKLHAILEIGKKDRAFRQNDGLFLRSLTQAASRRIGHRGLGAC